MKGKTNFYFHLQVCVSSNNYKSRPVLEPSVFPYKVKVKFVLELEGLEVRVQVIPKENV